MIGTFGYKGSHYLSEDLIDFVQYKKVVDFPISDTFLKNMELGKYWPKVIYKNDVREKVPMSMFDLMEHMKRMLKADYNYPIIVYKDVILDGVHRVMHAAFDKVSVIKAIILQKEDMVRFVSMYEPYSDRDGKINKNNNYFKTPKLVLV